MNEPVRERILDATLRLIADEGLDAVRHRRVAELAAVSLGSTTYHFVDRDELIREAFRRYLVAATEFIDEIEANTDELVEFVVELVRREFLDTDLVMAEYELLLYAARHRDFAAELRAWESAQAAALAARFAAAGAEEPGVAARTVIAVIRGIEVGNLVGKPLGRRALTARVRPVIESFLDRAVAGTDTT
jgi:TetR/AcrR family transcriptional regulator, regulator of biofilm formation and stress response